MSIANSTKGEWEETTLGKHIEIIGGGTPKTSVQEYWNGDIPWLSVVDFNEKGRWVYGANKHISQAGVEASSTRVLDKGDLILSARGTVGALAQLAIPMAFNQSCYGIRARKTAENNFLYYLIKNNVGQFFRNVHGAVFDTITRETFDQIHVFLPPIEEQRQIADVLSSLENKIELLRKQNSTLEQIARVIFHNWFVEFNFPNEKGLPYKMSGGKMIGSEFGEIPQGWKIDKISNYVDIRGGTTPSTKVLNFWNGNIAWTSPKDLSGLEGMFLSHTEKRITEKGLKQIGSGLLPKGTLLLSSRAPIGYLAITKIDISINQGYIALLPDQIFSNHFMFLWLKENMQKVISASNGSTFLEISKSSFKNIECVVPKAEVLKEFDVLARTIFEKISKNLSQIETLSYGRDFLLPKLMSGELRVKI